MLILHLTPLRNDKYKLVLDNDESFKVSENTKVEFFLYAGKELSKRELKAIKSLEDVSKDYEYTLKLVSKKDYTAAEIKTKLLKREVSLANIKTIIKKLQSFGFINDERYAQERTSLLIEQKMSRQKIQRYLMKKGIDKYLIEDILAEHPDDEQKNIYSALPKLIKKNSHRSIFDAQQKITAKLITEGFKSGDIKDVLRDVMWEEHIDEAENIKKAYEKIEKRNRKGEILDFQLVYTILRKAGYSSAHIRELTQGENYED